MTKKIKKTKSSVNNNKNSNKNKINIVIHNNETKRKSKSKSKSYVKHPHSQHHQQQPIINIMNSTQQAPPQIDYERYARHYNDNPLLNQLNQHVPVNAPVPVPVPVNAPISPVLNPLLNQVNQVNHPILGPINKPDFIPPPPPKKPINKPDFIPPPPSKPINKPVVIPQPIPPPPKQPVIQPIIRPIIQPIIQPIKEQNPLLNAIQSGIQLKKTEIQNPLLNAIQPIKEQNSFLNAIQTGVQLKKTEIKTPIKEQSSISSLSAALDSRRKFIKNDSDDDDNNSDWNDDDEPIKPFIKFVSPANMVDDSLNKQITIPTAEIVNKDLDQDSISAVHAIAMANENLLTENQTKLNMFNSFIKNIKKNKNSNIQCSDNDYKMYNLLKGTSHKGGRPPTNKHIYTYIDTLGEDYINDYRKALEIDIQDEKRKMKKPIKISSTDIINPIKAIETVEKAKPKKSLKISNN